MTGRGVMRSGVGVGLLYGSLVLGCVADQPQDRWTGEMSDSAGVTIVLNPASAAAETPRWTLTPRVRIGGDQSRPETLFTLIEDVAVDARGRIYVLDPTAYAVRVFEADGRTAGTLGSRGEGPGELGRFTSSVLVLPEDTVLVADWGQRRLNVFLSDGRFERALPLPLDAPARSWWAVGSDGRVYARRLTRVVVDGAWGGEDVLFAGHPAASMDTLLTFRYAESDLGGPGQGNLKVPLIVNAPSWAPLRDGGVAWTSLDRSEVRVHDARGVLTRVIRSEDWEPGALGPATRRALTDKLGEKLAMLGGDPAGLADMDITASSTLPALTGVRAAPDGSLWVQRMGAVEDVHPMALNGPDHPEWIGGPHWDVLDPEGRRTGSVRLPDRARVMRILRDAVVVVERDALDVERVVVLELGRPEAPGDG